MFSLFQTIKCELQIAAETGLDVQVSLRTITYRIPRSASIVVRSVGDPYVLLRIQDVKKLGTDPDPGRTSIRIRIQATAIRIRIRQKKDQVPGNEENH